MGKGTLVGVIAGFAAIFGAMVMEGGNPASLIAPPALLLIVVGTFGAACAGTSLETALDALRAIPLAFAAHEVDRPAIVERFMGYADQARREGLLSLEETLDREAEPMVVAGVRMLIDGSDPSVVRSTVVAMTLARRRTWDRRADFWSKMGGYAPTLGIIGTVLGLIHTLESLGGDPAELGHLIAAAFIATFFGVMFANVLFLPFAAKFKLVGAELQALGELVCVGVDLLGQGASQMIVRERLVAHLTEDDAVTVSQLQRAA